MKRKLYESSWLEIEETRKEEILENLRNDTEKFHNVIPKDTTSTQSINCIDYYDTVVRDVTKDERTTMYDFVCSNGFIFAFMACRFSKDDEIKKAAFDLLDEIFTNHYQVVWYFLPKSKKHDGRDIYEAYHTLRSFDWINALKSHGFTEDIDPEHASLFALAMTNDLCYYYTNHKVMETVPVKDRALIYTLSETINRVIGKHRIIMNRPERFMFPKIIDAYNTDGEIIKSYFNHGEIDESKGYVTIRDNGIYDSMMIWLMHREDLQEFTRIRQAILTKFHDYICQADRQYENKPEEK